MSRLADKGQRTIRVLNYNFFLYWNYCFAVFVRQQQLLTLSRRPCIGKRDRWWRIITHRPLQPSATSDFLLWSYMETYCGVNGHLWVSLFQWYCLANIS